MKTLEERFWEKVKKGDGCWEWTGSRSGKPPFAYGSLGALHTGKRTVKAHRLSWELANGPIPTGMCICHKCDTPLCVNPAHLFAASQRENIRDMMTKGRGRQGSNPRIGDSHGISKLKAVNIPAIRQAIFSGVSQDLIAVGYRVSQAAISKLHTGKTWGHIT